MTMTESSTTIPSTTIRAASVIVLSGIPARYMMPTEMNVVTGMAVEATSAELNGKRIIIVRMMTAIEMNRSRRNELTLALTTPA